MTEELKSLIGYANIDLHCVIDGTYIIYADVKLVEVTNSVIKFIYETEVTNSSTKFEQPKIEYILQVISSKYLYSFNISLKDLETQNNKTKLETLIH